MAMEVQDQQNDKSEDTLTVLLDDSDEQVDDKETKPLKSAKSGEGDKDDKGEESDTSEDSDSELSLSDDDTESSDLTYTSLPPVRELKEKFPDFFKKYPNIEKTLRRESHYAEVFPTIQEARDAAESVRQFNEIKSELNSGSVSGLLNSLKRENNSAFEKITDELLDTVRQLDKEAFNKITSDNVSIILKNAFGRFKDSDKESNDYQVALAAQVLYNYIFGGSTRVTDAPRQATDQKSEKEKEFERKANEFEQKKFNSAVNENNSRVRSIVEKSIEKAIDPREQMSPYVKSKAIKDCIDGLVEAIQGDTRFNKLLEGAYHESRKDDYSDKSKAKIRKMLLNRAETLLPGIMKKVKDEALKGVGRKEKPADEKPLARGRASTNSSSSNKGSQDKQKAAIPAGMSSIDYLNSDLD